MASVTIKISHFMKIRVTVELTGDGAYRGGMIRFESTQDDSDTFDGMYLEGRNLSIEGIQSFANHASVMLCGSIDAEIIGVVNDLVS